MNSKSDTQTDNSLYMANEKTTTSVRTIAHMSKINPIRRKLILLLTIMFTFSFLYLMFITFTCAFEQFLWLCQYYNRHYEFFWALLSVVYDGIWLLAAYRCYHRLLLCFAWLSGGFLIIFGILLVMALLNVLQTLMIIHMIPSSVLFTSITSILSCIITTIVQIIIIFFSFKLSKTIVRQDDETAIY